MPASTTSTNRPSLLSIAIKRLSIVSGVAALTAATAAWTSYQAAWVVLTGMIVAAVYWWGVGTGSRYEPPPLEHLTTVEGPREGR